MLKREKNAHCWSKRFIWVFPKYCQWILWIQWQKYYILKMVIRACHFLCKRPRRYQFMLQWFIRFPEFTEFLIHLGKTPLFATRTFVLFTRPQVQFPPAGGNVNCCCARSSDRCHRLCLFLPESQEETTGAKKEWCSTYVLNSLVLKQIFPGDLVTYFGVCHY